MTNLKGLLLKDLLVFKSYKKNVIISFISFTLLLFISSLNYNMLVYGPLVFLMFFGMNSISTFSYDEAADADAYVLALTPSKKDIVKAKFLSIFLLAFTSLFIGIIIILIIYIVLGKNFNGLNEAINSWFLTFSFVSFLMCSEVPCIYKWGVEKGRMQALLVPVVIVVIMGLVFSITVFIIPSLFQKKYLDLLLQNIPILCIITNILMYFISYKLSYKIFANKDV